MQETEFSTKEICTFIIIFHWRRGRVPNNAEELRAVIGLSKPVTEESFQKVLTKEATVEYLEQQGVPVREKPDHSLSVKQLALIRELVCGVSDVPVAVKLKKLGITTQQYNAWLRIPVFCSVLESEQKRSFADARMTVYNAVARKASKGDINAAKFMLELLGDYTPPSRSNNVNVQVNNVELNSVVNRLIEIMQEELPPELMARVYERFEEATKVAPRNIPSTTALMPTTALIPKPSLIPKYSLNPAEALIPAKAPLPMVLDVHSTSIIDI